MWIVTSPPQPQSQFFGGHGAGLLLGDGVSGAGGVPAVGVDGGGKPLGKESVWPGGAAWLSSVGVVAVGVVGVLAEGVMGVSDGVPEVGVAGG